MSRSVIILLALFLVACGHVEEPDWNPPPSSGPLKSLSKPLDEPDRSVPTQPLPSAAPKPSATPRDKRAQGMPTAPRPRQSYLDLYGARNAGPQRTFVPNMSLIIPWNEFTKKWEPFRYPYVVTYERDGKRLIYVAATHTNDHSSLTFRLIEAAFSKYKIDFAIVEGIPTTPKPSPANAITHAAKVARTQTDSEVTFTIRKALENRIHFIGGEPTDLEVVEALEDRGLEATDMLGFYFVRSIKHLIRQKKIKHSKDKRLPGIYRDYARNFVRRIYTNAQYLGSMRTFKGFKTWYERTNGVPFETGYVAADSVPSSIYKRRTNFIADWVGEVRERQIVKTIAAAMNRYKTVLIVYGASHHTVHEPVLRDMIGDPTYQRDDFLTGSAS